MRFHSRILIAATAVLSGFAIPATASAVRVYYLVGVRHVYLIGTDMYAHAPERKQIEEEYAAEVSADNAHYQYQISHGANAAAESAQLGPALHDLAVERDKRLSALYKQNDCVRADHSNFNVKVDGPYQVIGVNYHDSEGGTIWDNCTAYAPWPGYTCVGPTPYGWSYGQTYSPGLFVHAYNGWYNGWVGFGCPAFVGFYGYGGPMVVAGLSVNIGIGFGIGVGFGGFYANPGLGGFYHRGPGYFARDSFRGRYLTSRGDPRAAEARRFGYAAGASAIYSARSAGYARGISAGSRSSFARGPMRSGAGIGRSGNAHRAAVAAARTRSRGASAARVHNGYAHSAYGAASRASGRGFARNSNVGRARNFTRSASTRRIGGSVRTGGTRAEHFRGATSGRTHSAPRSRSGGSSHTAFRARYGGGGRSFGGGRTSFGGRSSVGGGRRSGGGRSRGGGDRRKG